MRLSNKDGNGHGEYKPEISYRYLAADVWVKKIEKTGDESIAYTEEIIAEIFGKTDSEDLNPDNKDNN
jgi:hypothetical protein